MKRKRKLAVAKSATTQLAAKIRQAKIGLQSISDDLEILMIAKEIDSCCRKDIAQISRELNHNEQRLLIVANIIEEQLANPERKAVIHV